MPRVHRKPAMSAKGVTLALSAKWGMAKQEPLLKLLIKSQIESARDTSGFRRDNDP